jgi:hypothetical protein
MKQRPGTACVNMCRAAAIPVSLVILAGCSGVPSGYGLASRFPGDSGLGECSRVFIFTDFESDEWKEQWDGVKSRTLSETGEKGEDDFVPLDGTALSVTIPAGQHYGVNLAYLFRKRTGKEPTELYFRYYLCLGDNWNPARGGILPGIAGTYNRAGWGGRRSDGSNGWSARGAYGGRKNGLTPIGFYCYHSDMTQWAGDTWLWETEGLGQLENNRWYCIEQYICLNRPGRKNGVLRGWVDGKLAFEKTDFCTRKKSELKIDRVWLNIYSGGNWTPSKDNHLYIDNIVVSERYVGPMVPAANEE